MALNTNRWGDAVAAAIQAEGITAGTPITTGQLEDIWRAIKGEDVTEITTNALVSTTVTGATGTGPSGGPLPITAQPGTGGVS